MNNLLDAVRVALAPLGYTTHLYAAPAVTAQYLILSAPSWDDPIERPLAEVDDSLGTDVRVKAVAGTPEGVEVMLRRVRGVLDDRGSWRALDTPGRSTWVRFVRAEFIDVDRDVVITGTNRHPGVGVDTYRLASLPV